MQKIDFVRKINPTTSTVSNPSTISGLELLYVGIASLINLFILFSAVQSQNPKVLELLTENMLETIRTLAPWQVYLLGLERILAMMIQVGLTVWVYQAVRQKKWIYLLAAYALHALFDLAPALSQVGWISNPLIVEGLLTVEVVGFIFLTKSIFCKKQ